jgi:hypothetical protein
MIWRCMGEVGNWHMIAWSVWLFSQNNSVGTYTDDKHEGVLTKVKMMLTQA